MTLFRLEIIKEQGIVLTLSTEFTDTSCLLTSQLHVDGGGGNAYGGGGYGGGYSVPACESLHPLHDHNPAHILVLSVHTQALLLAHFASVACRT